MSRTDVMAILLQVICMALLFSGLQAQSCGQKEFDEPTGQITSPNYPLNYPDNVDCTWIIRAPPGHTVIVNIDFFSLEEGSCNYDYVQFSNSFTDAPKLCGSRLVPGSMISHDNYLEIIFHSDVSLTSTGFRFSYTTQLKVSENDDDTLNGNSDVWHFNWGANEANVSNSSNPEWGMNGTNIWNSSNPDWGTNETNIWNYSSPDWGMNETNIWNSSNPDWGMNEAYIGNSSNPDWGTNDDYVWKSTSPDKAQSCGQIEFDEPTGQITSPNYPSNYPDNVDCTWIIRAPPGHTVIVNIDFFSLEENNCRFDYVQFSNFEHYFTDSPKFCGSRLVPGSMISQNNYLEIKFHSDGSHTYRGFKFSYTTQLKVSENDDDSLNGNSTDYSVWHSNGGANETYIWNSTNPDLDTNETYIWNSTNPDLGTNETYIWNSTNPDLGTNETYIWNSTNPDLDTNETYIWNSTNPDLGTNETYIWNSTNPDCDANETNLELLAILTGARM